MAHHRIAHPQDVEGCFGCKVLGVGFDGKHLTLKTTIRSDLTGNAAGYQVEHRSGRQDAVARPDQVYINRKGLFGDTERD